MSDLPPIGAYLAPFEGLGSIYLGVLAMGFFYGLTVCSLSCLPLVAPYVFATQTGFRRAFDVTAIFILARVVGYTLLGVLSGLVGKVVLEKVGIHAPMLVAGAVVLLIGGFIALRPRRTSCSRPASPAVPRRQSSRHMAALGLATSLTPCPPLYAVMLYAATTQSAVTGGVLAFLFGFGTLASPLYYLGAATGWLSGRIGHQTAFRYSGLLRSFSGLVILLFGLKLVVSGASGL
ncbi:MAG: hypothetical protein C0606_06275 [Hyphomicrobiales bacterium]|nr:MAG: hypothetical protein C0606_06275 [Hyphomicrobiales bacterium]